ncbi:MAG TPA: ABC transporter permease subunit, partial [Anaerolineales bacterium]|nr:ABC transporter permease subunit [Anaerolineales bacterium]
MNANSIRSLVLVFLKRLLFGLFVLVALIYLTHFGLDMARGLPFWQAAGEAVGKTGAYVLRVARGDFGMTQAGSINLLASPVSEIVPERFVRSLGLLAVSLSLAAVTGVVLGIYAAWNRGRSWPALALLLSIIGVSIPSFFAALLLQMAVIRLTRLTGTSWLPVGGFGWDAHILLPALVLAARPLAQITRVTTVSLSETLRQDYVRTAYSKGLTDRMVLARHILRNIAVPVLTTIGLSLSFALSSLPVVEYFFGWPGLGFTLLRSISLQDDNLTVALVLCMGSLFILLNLVFDLAYRIIDPRLAGAPEYVRQSGRRSSLLRRVAGFARSLAYWVRNNPLQVWLARRNGDMPVSPYRTILEERGTDGERELPKERLGERRAWLQATLGNLMFVLGGVLVALLIGVVLFGPQLAPHSPYTTQGLKVLDGKIMVPPFEPGEIHPWGTDVLGRDMLSLILAGAQQTLILAMLVVLARLVVGFLLGAFAGWFPGSTFDRGLMGLTEVFNAFPSLLLAMILILGLGIRRGMSSFVIALCFLGWPEIMRFVRGEVMGIRPRLFIESAVALGQTNGRIVFKHVLPNLVPGLISLISLEMGAVLMLLGELGFIGIFIGGGAFAELDVASMPYHYSDVPEWGALLSNVRAYARAYPWTAFYPALAFFVAILGFNVFGEGVRRLVEIVGVSITRVFNRYSLGLTLFAVVGFVALRGSTGSMAYYTRQAENFSGEQARLYLEDLT